MSVTYRKILIPHYKADMKENWNHKWPLPDWITFTSPFGLRSYSSYVDAVSWIEQHVQDPKRNARWTNNRSITVKFRKREDATAFRLAFSDFKISN